MFNKIIGLTVFAGVSSAIVMYVKNLKERVKYEELLIPFKSAFTENAYRLECLYEYLYITVNSNRPQIIINTAKNWEYRLVNACPPKIWQLWEHLLKQKLGIDRLYNVENLDVEKVKEHLKTWLSILLAVGVKRDNSKDFIINEESYKYYNIEEKYSYGDNAFIKEACWTLNGEVIEKGTASIVKV